ncbi:MAG: glutamine-hydrolyzing carbamoyl-phosphate synthase small subunit [Promethearchaeota archaeon]
MIYKTERSAILMFQDGTYYEGIGFGAINKVSGEITFTSIPGSGYIEILTDSTFKDNIVLFTYPSIGNYGVPAREIDENGILRHFESDSIQLKGIIVNEYCQNPNHYESIRTLEEWLLEQNIPGIQWVDTRAMTQTFVEKGSQLGLLEVYEEGENPNIEELKNEVKKIVDPSQNNLVEMVSVKEIKKFSLSNPKGKILILDLGVKNGLLRTLLQKNLDVIIAPYDYSYEKIIGLNPNGILITNGPGNPLIYKKTIDTVKKLIDNSIPTIGIGLGHVILGLAAGMTSYKLTAEHRGGRTTVESATDHCFITFQNHAYFLKDCEMNGFKQYFYDKDDNTNEGLIHENKPIFSVAFNPEGSPGALDMRELIFNKFIKLLEL